MISTVCVGYVRKDGDKNKLYVANAGDSRAIVVCADGSAEPMSFDHKPDAPAERKRIEAALHEVMTLSTVVQGRRVKISRVDGLLAVARAIGDFSLKDDHDHPEKCAVTCVPEVKNLELVPGKHLYLVIACDGIWDVLSNADVASIVMGELRDKKGPVDEETLNKVAEVVVKNALEKDSTDNCTVVVVAL